MSTGAEGIRVELGEGDRPPSGARRVRYVLADSLPLEYVTHVWFNDFGPGNHAYELRLHRLNVPALAHGESLPEVVEAPCVARVVLSDGTLNAMLRLITGIAGARLGLKLVEVGAEEAEVAESAAETRGGGIT